MFPWQQQEKHIGSVTKCKGDSIHLKGKYWDIHLKACHNLKRIWNNNEQHSHDNNNKTSTITNDFKTGYSGGRGIGSERGQEYSVQREHLQSRREKRGKSNISITTRSKKVSTSGMSCIFFNTMVSH